MYHTIYYLCFSEYSKFYTTIYYTNDVDYTQSNRAIELNRHKTLQDDISTHGVFLFFWTNQTKKTKQTSLKRNTLFAFWFDYFWGHAPIRAFPMTCFDHVTHVNNGEQAFCLVRFVCSFVCIVLRFLKRNLFAWANHVVCLPCLLCKKELFLCCEHQSKQTKQTKPNKPNK